MISHPALTAGILCLLLTGPTEARAAPTAQSGAPRSGQDDRTKPLPSLRVTVREQARVAGLVVRLDDCATIQSTDEDLARSLGSIEIGKTPRGTWTRTLQLPEILQALEQRGVAASRIKFEGAKACEIVAATSRVTTEDLIRAAEGVLRIMLQEEGEHDAEWTVQTKLRPMLVPRGRRTRRLRAEPTLGRIERSSALVRVDILVDEEPWTAVSVAFRIKRYRNVLVTKTSLRPGQAITAGDVATQRVDISRKGVEPISDMQLIADRVAARRIRTGETLTLNDLKRPAVVRKKDNVTVVAAIGRIRIARKGVALAEGGRGDTIPVQVDPKRPPISAEILGPGLLIIPGLRSSTQAIPVPASMRRR